MANHFELIQDFFSAQQCNVCLVDVGGSKNQNLIGKKSLKCKGCKLVTYCGVLHQRLDWQEHRDFCKAICKLMRIKKIEHPLLIYGDLTSLRDVQRAIIGMKFFTRQQLGRKLHFHEEEMLSYPAFCWICFGVRNTKPCKKCFAISYCSKDHAAADSIRHERFCGYLALYYCPLKADIKNFEKLQIIKRDTRILEHDLFDCLEYISDIKIPLDASSSKADYELFNKAGDLTWLCTICYIIEISKLNKQRNALNIFIVGATYEQMLLKQAGMDLIFMQNPHLKKVKMFFIGPDVPETIQSSLSFHIQGEEREIVFESFSDYFQRFDEAYDKFQPAMLIAFNCGFSEFNNWYGDPERNLRADCPVDRDFLIENPWFDGIKMMTHMTHIPIAFTSYTYNESKMDKETFLQVAVSEDRLQYLKTIVDTKVNPYRDIRPIRNMYHHDEEQIFFRNGYLNCFMFEENRKF